MENRDELDFIRLHLCQRTNGVCEDVGIEGAEDWWARVIAFDALIGNTDRHSQNWGFLVDQDGARRMAPMFDNGTSLGYQTLDAAIDAGLAPAALDRFVRKGSHSCSWAPDDATAHDHVGLCSRFAEAYPGAVSAMRAAVAITDAALEGFLHACVGIDVHPRFTAGRAGMVGGLVRRRRDLLVEALGRFG